MSASPLGTEEPSALDFDRQISQAASEAAGNARRQRQQSAQAARIALARKRERQSRAVVLCLILVSLLTTLTALNLSGHGPFRIATETPVPQRSQLLEELYFEYQEVEDYRSEQKVLPTNLSSLGYTPDEGLSYELIGLDDYRLTLTDQGLTVSYDSRQPAKSVFGDLIIED